MLGSYRKKKRYHRLRDGAFVDLSDFELAQLDRLASDLGITQKELATGTVELPSFRAFYLDEEAEPQPRPQLHTVPERFPRDRRAGYTRYRKG